MGENCSKILNNRNKKCTKFTSTTDNAENTEATTAAAENHAEEHKNDEFAETKFNQESKYCEEIDELKHKVELLETKLRDAEEITKQIESKQQDEMEQIKNDCENRIRSEEKRHQLEVEELESKISQIKAKNEDEILILKKHYQSQLSDNMDLTKAAVNTIEKHYTAKLELLNEEEGVRMKILEGDIKRISDMYVNILLELEETKMTATTKSNRKKNKVNKKNKPILTKASISLLAGSTRYLSDDFSAG